MLEVAEHVGVWADEPSLDLTGLAGSQVEGPAKRDRIRSRLANVLFGPLDIAGEGVVVLDVYEKLGEPAVALLWRKRQDETKRPLADRRRDMRDAFELGETLLQDRHPLFRLVDVRAERPEHIHAELGRGGSGKERPAGEPEPVKRNRKDGHNDRDRDPTKSNANGEEPLVSSVERVVVGVLRFFSLARLGRLEEPNPE